MRKLSLTILAILLSTLLLSGCSKEEGSISEKASKKVDEITTKAADTMVKKIRTPLDKARSAKDLGNERTDAIDRMMKEQ